MQLVYRSQLVAETVYVLVLKDLADVHNLCIQPAREATRIGGNPSPRVLKHVLAPPRLSNLVEPLPDQGLEFRGYGSPGSPFCKSDSQADSRITATDQGLRHTADE